MERRGREMEKKRDEIEISQFEIIENDDFSINNEFLLLKLFIDDLTTRDGEARSD